MTAIISLGGIRYKSDRPGPSPGGTVILESGARRQLSDFAEVPNRGVSVLIRQAEGFSFSGSLIIEILDNDGSGGTFTIQEPGQPQRSASHRVEGTHPAGESYAFDLLYHVSPAAPDRGIDVAGARIEVCEARVARNSWNCLVPPEAGLAFAPRHYRRRLAFCGGGTGGPNQPPNPQSTQRDKAVAIGLAGSQSPSPRWVSLSAAYRAVMSNNNWRGPYYVPGISPDPGYGHWMQVIEHADVGEFQGGMSGFLSYWQMPDSAGTIVDNGIWPHTDLTPSLTGQHSHGGQGDHRVNTSPDPGSRIKQVLRRLYAYIESGGPPLSVVAFFCHGWREGMQLGIDDMGFNPDPNPWFTNLVNAIKKASREDVVVVFYACSTGKGSSNDPLNRAGTEDSFAARMRDALIDPPSPKPNCRVIGHTTVGNAVSCPYLCFFEGRDGSRVPGTIVMPGPATSLMFRRFRHYLSDNSPHPGFPYAYPFMSVESIREFVRMDNPPADAYQMPED